MTGFSIRAAPAFVVVGPRLWTPPGSAEIPPLWHTFMQRFAAIPHKIEPDVAYGVMGDHDAAANRFHYLAGVRVSAVDDVPEDLSVWRIPANDYAVFDTTLATLGNAYAAAGAAIRAAGCARADAPYFERYGPDYSDPRPLQLWFPIRRNG